MGRLGEGLYEAGGRAVNAFESCVSIGCLVLALGFLGLGSAYLINSNQNELVKLLSVPPEACSTYTVLDPYGASLHTLLGPRANEVAAANGVDPNYVPPQGTQLKICSASSNSGTNSGGEDWWSSAPADSVGGQFPDQSQPTYGYYDDSGNVKHPSAQKAGDWLQKNTFLGQFPRLP